MPEIKGVYEEVAPTGDHGSGATEDRPDAHQEPDAHQNSDARQELKDRLCKLDKRLRAMVDKYVAKPSNIDIALNPAGRSVDVDSEVDVEATIIKIYEIMYGTDSPLRVDSELWEAFKTQEQEFTDDFYHPALNALEIYKDVLKPYTLVKGDGLPRVVRGEIEPIRQDKRALVAERMACIQAIRDFQRKFSLMLTVLN